MKKVNSNNDRQFFISKDKGIKFSGIIEKNEFLKKCLSFFSNHIFKVIRKIYQSKASNNRIAVISLNRLGDTVFTIPALIELYGRYPDSEITIVAYPDNIPILKIKFPNLKFISVNKNEFKLGRRIASAKARREIKKLNASTIFDFTGSITSASLIFTSSANKIVGKNLEYFKNIYTKFCLPRTEPHFMDIYFDVVKLEFDVMANPKAYEFETKINPDGYVLIHPFAIRSAKEWNLKKYISLADKLGKNYNVKIIAPQDYMPAEFIEEINALNIPFNTTKTIEELITEIQNCSVFISNDSGPVYIASMLGKPTFTIYGPTNPKFSLPFGKNHSYIQNVLPCSASNKLFCDTVAGIYCPHHDCLNLLTVDDVYKTMKKFIEGLGVNENKKRFSELK